MGEDRFGFVPRSDKSHNNTLNSNGVFDEYQE